MIHAAGQGLELDVIFCGHGVDGMEHTLRYLVNQEMVKHGVLGPGAWGLATKRVILYEHVL